MPKHISGEEASNTKKTPCLETLFVHHGTDHGPCVVVWKISLANVQEEPYLGFTWGTTICALPFMAEVLSISPTSHFLSIPDFLWGNHSLLSKTCRLKSVTSCDESSAWRNLGLAVWGRFCWERKPTHPSGPDMPDTLQWTTAMAKQFLMYIWKQHSRKKHVVKETWEPPWGTFVWCLCCRPFAQVAEHVEIIELWSTEQYHKSVIKLTHTHCRSSNNKDLVHLTHPH